MTESSTDVVSELSDTTTTATSTNGGQSPMGDTVPDGYEPTQADYDAATAELENAETFPRAYVEDLRRENAEHRTKSKRADDLAARLMAATVTQATAGILTDPTDLPATDDLLDTDGYPDAEKITAAARDLVARKPHLGDRRPRGDIGQGVTDQSSTVSLAGMLRAHAS